MSKSIMATAQHGISVTYICKSIRAKYRGKKCKDFATDLCMTCDLCEAVMPARDATRLLKGFDDD